MNLATLAKSSTSIGRSATIGAVVAGSKRNLPFIIGCCVALLLLAGAVIAFIKRRKSAVEQPLNAGDVFKMPADLDGFAIVALLRRLRASPLVALAEPQKAELQQDLQRVQQTCFDTKSNKMSEAELRSVAEKWLRLAR